MDPALKIFEIVSIPYEPETTTIGDVLNRIKFYATDIRLAKQLYTGLSHKGVHLTAEVVPIDILLLDRDTETTPLVAVPEHYTASQIHLVASKLMDLPQVSRLIKYHHHQQQWDDPLLASTRAKTMQQYDPPLSISVGTCQLPCAAPAQSPHDTEPNCTKVGRVKSKHYPTTMVKNRYMESPDSKTHSAIETTLPN